MIPFPESGSLVWKSRPEREEGKFPPRSETHAPVRGTAHEFQVSQKVIENVERPKHTLACMVITAWVGCREGRGSTIGGRERERLQVFVYTLEQSGGGRSKQLPYRVVAGVSTEQTRAGTDEFTKHHNKHHVGFEVGMPSL
ncbi:hypothetical protein Pmani_012834 [Petrolisthes manimaculis]|uniref:Uncharacterized protein n=1 Tax=Petrolisthes manimaculis TaxID=1843537 RepID=A0AAE1PWG6_9EUCA|nr:hypothetical protein Pmani_012834 [Petrolisthes manimaculis]